MIKRILKLFLPQFIRQWLVAIRKRIRYTVRKYILKAEIRKSTPLKIIVGAAETHQQGWLSTNEQWLDITSEEQWYSFFGDQQLISHIVAEHVFEHLTQEGAIAALESMRKRLVPGGKIRIAVPDGYNPKPEYIRHVGIGGIGDDASDHKQLLNADSLSKLMIAAGLTVQHIEGYTKDGELITNQWHADDGFIRRSRQNMSKESWNFPDAATSLIVDGSKP
ncbi:methyltransferase domain-containing protein [Candidatus Ponderosibacter sp. Uisw_141_02]|uniref:methyltransferase domain-containing protein n=1 Tax=Candidatus Ponderosibacter sp. Uisw_141_02 TaxID=3231000 RepID=UPI003D5C5BF9